MTDLVTTSIALGAIAGLGAILRLDYARGPAIAAGRLPAARPATWVRRALGRSRRTFTVPSGRR